MSNNDVKRVLENLRAAYPSYKPPNLEAMVSLWLRWFSKVDGDVLLMAADMHIGRSKFFPGVSEIQELIPQAEYKTDNKRVVTNLYELRAWSVELENRFYREGLFEQAEWEKLIEKYKSLGHEACADATRKRMEAIG